MSINESNFRQYFKTENGESFIPYLKDFNDLNHPWIGTLSAIYYRINQKYVEIANELPPINEAINKFHQQGLEFKPISRHKAFKGFNLRMARHSLAGKAGLCIRILSFLRKPFKKHLHLDYPLAASYSDIVLVNGKDMERFSHYCGVFGSSSLFVEVAAPTALILAASTKISTEKDTILKGRSYWKSPENVFCESEDYTFDNLEKSFGSLSDILDRFPNDALYLHPIKLSRWLKTNDK